METSKLIVSPGFPLIRTDPALRAGPAKLALSQVFRQNPSLAAALRLPGRYGPAGPPDWDFGEFRGDDEFKNDF